MTEAHERVLTFTVTLRVPAGLKRNIRLRRIEEAQAKLEALLMGYASTLLPEAESIEVSGTWNYRLYEDSRHIRLPPTPENTL